VSCSDVTIAWWLVVTDYLASGR